MARKRKLRGVEKARRLVRGYQTGGQVQKALIKGLDLIPEPILRGLVAAEPLALDAANALFGESEGTLPGRAGTFQVTQAGIPRPGPAELAVLASQKLAGRGLR